uniref:Uncharacterized protein n=1 Tax=viral metagenome TaxID=1070528 RepID=A0A6H1ZXR3_9ZZZZ
MTLENEKLRRLCDELHKQLARERESVNEFREANQRLREIEPSKDLYESLRGLLYDLREQIASEQERVIKFGEANQRLEAEVERLKKDLMVKSGLIHFLRGQNQDLNQSCIQWKAKNKRLLKKALEE